ncbi:MAG: hypothetical protein ACTHMC_28425 [Pseudobacter sp.]|uniref:hypothetical protein n=1 Tax=Pseudobacter sp. TaxID=2045420 RepID=UPI003F7EE7D2
MGLIRKIIDQLFGNKRGPALSAEAQMEKYEQEHQQRLLDYETELRVWLVPFLKEKAQLAVSWECGHDEGIISFNEGIPANREAEFHDLEDYLFNKLELPSAGEFMMTGGGHLYLQGNAVKIKYNSVFREMLDYDEELGKEIYGEDIEIEDYAGDVVLFS